jgi:hypothetical protein
MFNISGFGVSVSLTASNTFPLGININQFSDDSDPVDVPSLQIADVAMGLNGDMISWSKANPIKIVLSVIPESDNDISLSILLSANRVGRGRISARDIITMNISYPDGNFVILTGGIITDGIPLSPVANSGRLKTRVYNFAFESYIGA